MPTIEIPPDAWPARLDEFTRVHAGWLVSLEIVGHDGPETEVHDLPLAGLSVDHSGGRPAVVVSAARSASEHITHVIDDVSRIRLRATDQGADAALELNSADGTATLLRLRTAALPETVDGVAPAGGVF